MPGSYRRSRNQQKIRSKKRSVPSKRTRSKQRKFRATDKSTFWSDKMYDEVHYTLRDLEPYMKAVVTPNSHIPLIPQLKAVMRKLLTLRKDIQHETDRRKKAGMLLLIEGHIEHFLKLVNTRIPPAEARQDEYNRLVAAIHRKFDSLVIPSHFAFNQSPTNAEEKRVKLGEFLSNRRKPSVVAHVF